VGVSGGEGVVDADKAWFRSEALTGGRREM